MAIWISSTIWIKFDHLGYTFWSVVTSPKKTIKRYRRFQGWDYSRGASLYITISTSPRRAIFGQVVGGEMKLSPLGKEALFSLESMPRYNQGLFLFGRVVMPDHIHFNCHIEAGLNEPLKFLGNAIRRFKNHISKVARAQLATSGLQFNPDGQAALDLTTIWQQGYYDRLLPSEPIMKATERYIAYNTAKWELMKNRPAALRIKEPLDSPRLDPNEYWKGVGNTSLLEESNKIVSLRISRKLGENQLKDVEKRVKSAIDHGFTLLSGILSPGEKLIRDLCCLNKNAKFIRILPSMMPISYRPESAYVKSFLENRYLEIAKGNEEVEFGRVACLDLNEEIVKIATAGEGLAVYWRAEGLLRLG